MPTKTSAPKGMRRKLAGHAPLFPRPDLMPRYRTEVFEDTFDATVRRGAVCFAQGACMRVDDPELNLKARSEGDCAGSECSPNAV